MERRLLDRLPGAHPKNDWFEMAGFKVFDLRTLEWPEQDVESPLGRELDAAWLLHEIISTQDALVIGGLESADAAVASRLIDAGILEERDARVGLTEDAAWGLYLEDELDLPCSGYRRMEIRWPIESPSAAA